MFSFTTDLWSSAVLDPYISLTIHFMTAEMQLERYVLETKYMPDKPTGVNLAPAVKELLAIRDFTKEHMMCINTDSAANIICMADAGGMCQLPWFGHFFRNAVSNRMENSTIQATTKKLRRVVAHFHQSHGRRKKLEAEQKN